jgi:hypothetical protein
MSEAWVWGTALGREVEPEVKNTTASSNGSDRIASAAWALALSIASAKSGRSSSSKSTRRPGTLEAIASEVSAKALEVNRNLHLDVTHSWVKFDAGDRQFRFTETPPALIMPKEAAKYCSEL